MFQTTKQLNMIPSLWKFMEISHLTSGDPTMIPPPVMGFRSPVAKL